MSIQIIAQKEFEDAVRKRTLQLLVGFFVAFTTIMFHYHRSRLGPSGTFIDLYDGILGKLGVIVPVLGVMVGYRAVVGERESGSLKLLLTLPHSRRDVMLGKFIGRCGIIVVTTVVGFVLIGLQTIVFTELFSLTEWLLAVGEITLFGIIFVAIAMAFSTAMQSARRAMIGAVGLTVLFSFLYDILILTVTGIIDPHPINGSPDPGPNWLFILPRLNPRKAFQTPEAIQIATPRPFYLEPWFGVVILVMWLVVPLGGAYLRFKRSDLA